MYFAILSMEYMTSMMHSYTLLILSTFSLPCLQNLTQNDKLLVDMFFIRRNNIEKQFVEHRMSLRAYISL